MAISMDASMADSKLEGDGDLRSESSKVFLSSGVDLLENVEAKDDCTSDIGEDNGDVAGLEHLKENAIRNKGSVSRISNLQRILRNALGVNMESSITSAIAKDGHQEISLPTKPRRIGKQVHGISNSISDLSCGKAVQLADDLVSIPAISVINKLSSINVGKIIRQVKDPNDSRLVTKDDEMQDGVEAQSEDYQLGKGKDGNQNLNSGSLDMENNVSVLNQDKSPIPIHEMQKGVNIAGDKGLGEYIKDSEQYLKNVIDMFNQPNKGNSNSGVASTASLKGRNIGVENKLDGGSAELDQKPKVLFSFGNSVVGKEDAKGEQERVASEMDLEKKGKNESAQVAKKFNPWGFNGVTLADKIKGNTESKITLSYKAPIVLEDGRQVIRFSKEVVMDGAKSNAMLIVAHFVGASMPFFVLNNNLNRLWKRCGLVNVASNYQGYYLLKFNNEEGMNYVLEKWAMDDQWSTFFCEKMGSRCHTPLKRKHGV
ncbi:hypothetical protein OSB04_un001016 [Centaurea solstitialis]|uniref:DUF4283 domain-containing protein n=1 Tax=Centaurea solstitialis TaxID=347529 RepID=A0AA38W234_9ASTR|nr:hypothetical protein OSB04_un001016 [Centaurea solstitialis]